MTWDTFWWVLAAVLCAMLLGLVWLVRPVEGGQPGCEVAAIRIFAHEAIRPKRQADIHAVLLGGGGEPVSSRCGIEIVWALLHQTARCELSTSRILDPVIWCEQQGSVTVAAEAQRARGSQTFEVR